MTSAETFISVSSQRLLLIACFEVQICSDLKEYVTAAQTSLFLQRSKRQEYNTINTANANTPLSALCQVLSS